MSVKQCRRSNSIYDFLLAPFLILACLPSSECKTSGTRIGVEEEEVNDINERKKLPAPAIAGIAVAVFILATVAALLLLRNHRHRKKLELQDLEAKNQAEAERDMEERKLRLTSVYKGPRYSNSLSPYSEIMSPMNEKRKTHIPPPLLLGNPPTRPEHALRKGGQR